MRRGASQTRRVLWTGIAKGVDVEAIVLVVVLANVILALSTGTRPSAQNSGAGEHAEDDPDGVAQNGNVSEEKRD